MSRMRWTISGLYVSYENMDNIRIICLVMRIWTILGLYVSYENMDNIRIYVHIRIICLV